MRPAPTDSEIDARLIRLEEKLSLAEDLLDTLNGLVAHQRTQIAHLMREVAQLQRQRTEEPPSIPYSLFDELPPHY